MRGVTDSCQNPPIGRPIGNTTVYLLDASAHLAPIGVGGIESVLVEDAVVLRPVAVDREDVSGSQRRLTCVAPSAGVTGVPDALRVDSLWLHRGTARGLALRGRVRPDLSRVRLSGFAP